MFPSLHAGQCGKAPLLQVPGHRPCGLGDLVKVGVGEGA